MPTNRLCITCKNGLGLDNKPLDNPDKQAVCKLFVEPVMGRYQGCYQLRSKDGVCGLYGYFWESRDE